MGIPRDMRLKGEDESRLILRPPDLDDAKAIYQAVEVSRAELATWMDWCTPDYSLVDTIEWLEKQPVEWGEESSFEFAVFDIHETECLGCCGLNHINRHYLLANLGYWTRADRTGEGFATEAARLVAKFGFSRLGLRRIEIVTGVDNLASRNVAEKVGAQFEGILRNRLRHGDRNVEAAMHALIPGDLS